MSAYPVRIFRGDLPAEMAQVFSATPRVAWDTETTGLDWRVARLATCQLFAEGAGVAIVSVGEAKPTRLASLLEDASVQKVFHHAPFDLRFMVNAWEVRPAAIRCTKVASKLLAPNAPNDEHSLQKLVARYLGVMLVKGSVRNSDWTAESLSAEQVEYAQVMFGICFGCWMPFKRS